MNLNELNQFPVRRIDVRAISRSTKEKPDTDLRLAKEYWLRTIQPRIAGRKLNGLEFYIAQDAHIWLQMIAGLAKLHNDSEAGKDSLVPVEFFPEWEKPEFQKPDELCADATLKPEVLAGIAASLINKDPTKLNQDEAVRTAHELVITARKHLDSLPKQQRIGSLPEIKALDFNTVSFAEIMRSNGSDSGRLPLLPPVQEGRNEGKMKLTAIQDAVKQFLADHNPTRQPNPIFTLADYEAEERQWQASVKKNEEDKAAGRHTGTLFRTGEDLPYQEWQNKNLNSIEEILNSQQISYRLLTVMRWNRFRDYRLEQQKRTETRESAKSAKLIAAKRRKR